MLYFESDLTKEEEKARDEMIYLFNPVLKFVLMNGNYNEFKKYGFNSCRQTAILGADYLKKLLPEYDIEVYEGFFIEDIDGLYFPYTHAFIIAHKDDRHLVIDLSRTTKKLLFSKTYLNIYPEIEDYENVTKLKQEKINLDEMINSDTPEYFTNKKPKELIKTISSLIDDMKLWSKSAQLEFCDFVYSKTTQLRR